MNSGIEKLQPYPFEKLADLFSQAGRNAGLPPINLSIGEPKHDTPAFILETLSRSLSGSANYPKTRGSDELRETIKNWLVQRFELPGNSLDINTNIIPVNGTREALFSFCQCLIDTRKNNPLVLSGNPFYQIYEGAAWLAGATPIHINCDSDADFAISYDSVSEENWKDCQLLYLCSPNNPTGNVCSLETYKLLFELAEEYDFVIAADECYSEIYLDESTPPIGLLQAAKLAGIENYQRCVVFHSLSKRSNVPGIRSGFVAGDANLLNSYFKYRTYQGCAMAPFIQQASIVAWQDEEHVKENRRLYCEKFDKVSAILQPVMNIDIPAATFYLWPETPIADDKFALELFQQQNVTVLPGSYLSRQVGGRNPGANRIRMALVASLAECEEAGYRIRNYINSI
ncbi:MAG: succinyldiaminopimelate transaminase [Gammaproteobacteria bacterium]|nr:succinyldiaminopimelate transaminase [Gammaproteobacteria bacterium]